MCIKWKNDIPVCQRTRRLSCSDNPSPMESKYRRFVLLRKIFQPWQWKRRKKRNRFEQTSRTLERKISCVQAKINLLKRRSYACETQCFPVEPSGCRRVLVCSVFFVCFRFSSGLDEKGKKEDVPLRTAYSQAGRLWQPKPSSLRAQVQLMRTETVETFELVKVEPKLLREEKGETERCASRRYLLHIIVKLIC
ncbi:hypothetical protein TNCV_1802041 [Trichonephila clavipes]|nr:hypothetical protein TNCV_1802041 [Trichonephila clavipes]